MKSAMQTLVATIILLCAAVPAGACPSTTEPKWEGERFRLTVITNTLWHVETRDTKTSPWKGPFEFDITISKVAGEDTIHYDGKTTSGPTKYLNGTCNAVPNVLSLTITTPSSSRKTCCCRAYCSRCGRCVCVHNYFTCDRTGNPCHPEDDLLLPVTHNNTPNE